MAARKCIWASRGTWTSWSTSISASLKKVSICCNHQAHPTHKVILTIYLSFVPQRTWKCRSLAAKKNETWWCQLAMLTLTETRLSLKVKSDAYWRITIREWQRAHGWTRTIAWNHSTSPRCSWGFGVSVITWCASKTTALSGRDVKSTTTMTSWRCARPSSLTSTWRICQRRHLVASLPKRQFFAEAIRLYTLPSFLPYLPLYTHPAHLPAAHSAIRASKCWMGRATTLF